MVLRALGVLSYVLLEGDPDGHRALKGFVVLVDLFFSQPDGFVKMGESPLSRNCGKV